MKKSIQIFCTKLLVSHRNRFSQYIPPPCFDDCLLVSSSLASEAFTGPLKCSTFYILSQLGMFGCPDWLVVFSIAVYIHFSKEFKSEILGGQKSLYQNLSMLYENRFWTNGFWVECTILLDGSTYRRISFRLTPTTYRNFLIECPGA